MWMDRGVNGIKQQSATFYTSMIISEFLSNSWTNLHVYDYDVDKLSNLINSLIKGFYEIILLFLNMFSVKIPVITQICTL